MSRLHAKSFSANNGVDILTILNERILQETLKNISDGNDEESVQVLAKLANKHGDLAILIFQYFSNLIQDESNTQNLSNKKINAFWTLVKNLSDEFTSSLDKPLYEKVQKKELNSKRKNPTFEEETKEEEDTQKDELNNLYKKSNNSYY